MAAWIVGCGLGLAAGLLAGAALAGERARPSQGAGPAPLFADCAPGLTPVPGTRTCLRLGGRVRAEAGAVRESVQGRATLDARTHTEFGPVRTFLQVGAGAGR